jgi:hypothetical protein
MSTQQSDQSPPEEPASAASAAGFAKPERAVLPFEEWQAGLTPLPPDDPSYQRGTTVVIGPAARCMRSTPQDAPPTPARGEAPSTASLVEHRFNPPTVTDWALLDALLKRPRSGDPAPEKRP